MQWFCITVDILILVFLNDKTYKILIKYWIIVLPDFNFIVIPFFISYITFFPWYNEVWVPSEKNYERASN